MASRSGLVGRLWLYLLSLGPLWQFLLTLALTALSAQLLSYLPGLALGRSSFLVRWGTMLELAGVLFIWREVWEAHREVGAPNPLRQALAKIGEFGSIFRSGSANNVGNLNATLGGISTIGAVASAQVIGKTLKRRVEILEGHIETLDRDLYELGTKIVGHEKAPLDGLKALKQRADDIEKRLSSELEKLATASTPLKLSGASLILFGLVLNSIGS